MKRSLIALLMLVLAGTWQITPSFAAPPCDMNAGLVTSSDQQTDRHCMSVVGDCVSATFCCQAAPNLLAPHAATFSPVHWNRIVYSCLSPVFVGQRPQPDLHPPTTLI